jgi:hypothetical protein
MASLAVMAVGTVLSASEEQQAGYRSMRQGKVQKALNEVAATQEVAVGQRRSLEAKRQADLVASRALAVASAGGAAQDIDNLIADITNEGSYEASVAMYEAETQAETLKREGRKAEMYGEDVQAASQKRALSTVLSGASKAYGSYG